MMLYPAMSLLNKYVENRYLLVNVVARRARQIAEQADGKDFFYCCDLSHAVSFCKLA